MGLVTLWRQIKNSQFPAISIGAIFLLSSRRCTENCWPFVLLRDVVNKETNHKTYHYIIQHFLTTRDRRWRDEMNGFCKAMASKAAAFQALDRLDTIRLMHFKQDLLSQRKVSNQTRAFCLFPMIQWQLTTEYSATWTISCGAPYAMHDTQKIITFMNYSIWLHTKRQIITCKRCPKQDGTFFIICRCTVDFVFRIYLVFTAKIHLQISRICVARLSICQYLPPFASHIGRKLMCCLPQKHIWRTMLSNSRNLGLWIPRTWQYSRTFLSLKPLFTVRKRACNKEAISACVITGPDKRPNVVFFHQIHFKMAPKFVHWQRTIYPSIPCNP